MIVITSLLFNQNLSHNLSSKSKTLNVFYFMLKLERVEVVLIVGEKNSLMLPFFSVVVIIFCLNE